MTSTGQTAARARLPSSLPLMSSRDVTMKDVWRVVRIPPELSSDPRVRYDAAASRPHPSNQRSGWTALSRLGPPAPGHGRRERRLILSAVAGISAVGLLGLAWSYRRRPWVRNGSAVLSLAFLVMIANSGLRLWLTGRSGKPPPDACGHRVRGWRSCQPLEPGLTVLTWLWTLGMLTIPARTGRTG